MIKKLAPRRAPLFRWGEKPFLFRTRGFQCGLRLKRYRAWDVCVAFQSTTQSQLPRFNLYSCARYWHSFAPVADNNNERKLLGTYLKDLGHFSNANNSSHFAKVTLTKYTVYIQVGELWLVSKFVLPVFLVDWLDFKLTTTRTKMYKQFTNSLPTGKHVKSQSSRV